MWVLGVFNVKAQKGNIMHVDGDGQIFRYVISHLLMGSLSLVHGWWYSIIADVGGEKGYVDKCLKITC